MATRNTSNSTKSGSRASSSSTKSSTYFHSLRNKRIDSADQLKNTFNGDWNTGRSSFASYVAHRPQFEKGTLAALVQKYLTGRKNPSTVNDIVAFVRKNRSYKNDSSARRSIVRVLAQLSNFNFVTPTKDSTPVSFLANPSAKMPKPQVPAKTTPTTRSRRSR